MTVGYKPGSGGGRLEHYVVSHLPSAFRVGFKAIDHAGTREPRRTTMSSASTNPIALALAVILCVAAIQVDPLLADTASTPKAGGDLAF